MTLPTPSALPTPCESSATAETVTGVIIDAASQLPLENIQLAGRQVLSDGALGAGQEVGDLAFVDGQGLHIASPGPVRHVRPVDVQMGRS